MKPPIKRFLLLLVVLLFTQRAYADIAIIDQQNTVGTFQTGPIVATGQSFTPTLPALDTIAVLLSTAGFGNPSHSLYLNLWSGAGFRTTLLGTSETVTLAGTAMVEFHFSSVIPLVPGNLYTFQIFGDGYFEASSFVNPYAGGIEFNDNGPNGTPMPERDLVFAEGLSVPEPSSLLLFLCGGLVCVLRLKERCSSRT